MEVEEETTRRSSGDEDLPAKEHDVSEIEMTSMSQKEQEEEYEDQPEEQQQPRSCLIKDVLKDWAASALIGFLVVSFWRGTWTLLDNWDCDQPNDASVIDGETFCYAADLHQAKRRDSGLLTYWISVILITVGVVVVWAGAWHPGIVTAGKKPFDTKKRAVMRFLAVYILGWAAVCMWRGIWYMIDYWVLYDNLVASYWTTTAAGLGGLFLICAGASVLAPPAIFVLDGPSVDSPPIAVTIISSIFDITLPADTLSPKLPRYVYTIDIIVSFFGVPILVVGFWRGFWGLMDEYLWGFLLETSDFNESLVWSAIIAVGCFFLASDDIVTLLPVKSKLVYRLLTRVRTMVLAVGAVNWWRVIWYTWDQYMSTSSALSAWLAHAIAVVGLTLMGCLCCIVAPPSTLGVDVLAHPECSDEPLFSNIPVPAEALYFCGIARQPFTQPVAEKKEDKVDIEELDEEERKRRFRREAMHHLEELGGSTRHLITYYEWQRRLPRPKRVECPLRKVLSKRNVMKREDILFRNR